jgi:hypothetical protein
MEPLTDIARESINDGIGMVTAYIGETVVTNEVTVRLVTDELGRVDPNRIGYGNLDKMVELHVMAVPLDRGEDERLGLAAIGRGWSYVDTSRDSAPIIRTTAAHEVAHALRFVVPGSEHEDPASPYHCCDGDCIMHKSIAIAVSELAGSSDRILRTQRMRSLLRRRGKAALLQVDQTEYLMDSQHDFCVACKVDMRDKGSGHVAKLRHDRLFVQKSV